MAHQTAFLDTNIVLHYQPITQIPWLDVLDCDSVELTIAQVVLEELDEQKDSGRTPRIKDRARKATHLVERAVHGKQPEGLGSEVTLCFVEEPSAFDYDGERLSHAVRDDRLLATIVDYRRQHPDREICLVTNDATPRVKAYSRGLEATDLPDAFRLDAESPVEKKLRKLKEQKREFDASTPSLSLTVLNGPKDTVLAPSIEPVEPLPEDEVRGRIEKLSDQIHEFAGGRLEPLTPSSGGGLTPIGVPEKERERFKREFEEWLDEYESFLRSRHGFVQVGRRLAKAILGIHNSGKVPAESIDVDLNVETDVEVWTEEDLPSEPKEPDPPRKPQTIPDQLNRLGRHAIGDYPSMLSGLSSVGLPSGKSKPTWDVREEGSIRMSTSLDQVKQDRTRELPPWWFFYDPDREPESFSVSYVLRADNVPGTTTGEFYVVVNED